MTFEIPDFEVETEIPQTFRRSISVPLDQGMVHVYSDSQAFVPGEELLKILGERDEILAPFAKLHDDIKPLTDEINQKRKELDKLVEMAASVQAEIRRGLAIKRQLEMQVQEAEKKFRQALENEKVRKEFIENSLKFDEITAGLAWREWALPHQIEGAKFLAAANGRAILADKMGLGKTLTSLIMCDMLQAQKILVIVPDDVVSEFRQEIERWAPHREVAMIGKQTRGGRRLFMEILAKMESYIAVVNYSAWRKDKTLLDQLVNLRFDTVIMDEAHTIKGTSTAAFKGCEKIVLSENSCPNCHKNVQKIHLDYQKKMDLRADHPDMYSFTRTRNDYWRCVGDVPTKEVTIDISQMITKDSCDWSELDDAVEGKTLEYGAMCSVKHVLPMTGTPILNKPTDLFASLTLIDHKTYDNQAEFARMYCYTDPYTNRVYFQPGGIQKLARALSGKFIARDKKSAGIILPPQKEIEHLIELDVEKYPGQAKVIMDLTRSAMLHMEKSQKAMPILATIELILRKRQANVWPAGIEWKDRDPDSPSYGEVIFSVGDEVRESIKLDRICTESDRTESGEFEGLIPEFTGMGDKINGERVVVFSQFKTPLIELEKRLKSAGITVVRFDGDTREDVKIRAKKDFNRRTEIEFGPGYEYEWQVILCNYKTGGVGLNFTAATQTIILDEEWNQGKKEQAYNRTDRIGQTEESTVHVLRLEKTVDQWMQALIEGKKDMAEGFETQANLQRDMYEAMLKGEML